MSSRGEQRGGVGSRDSGPVPNTRRTSGMSSHSPKRKSGGGKKRPALSWIYAFKLPNIGDFDDLELEMREVLELEKFVFRGLRFKLLHMVEREKEFRVEHELAMGKKEELLANGQKDKRRAEYTLKSSFEHGSWRLGADWTPSHKTKVDVDYIPNENFKALFKADLSARNTNWDLETSWKLKDMCLVGNWRHEKGVPSVQVGYLQPLTTRWGMGTMLSCKPTKAKDNVELKHLIHYDYKWTDEHGLVNRQSLNMSMVRGQGDDLDLNGTFKFNNGGVDWVFATEGSYRKGLGKPEHDWTTVGKLGYIFDNPQLNLSGYVDTNGSLLFNGSQNIGLDTYMSCNLNINFPKNVYDVGFGFTLGIA